MVKFKDITTKFTLEFCGLKDLAEELRNILFLIRSKLFTRTYKDRSIVYRGIINTFNKAINHLEKGPLVKS